MKHNLTQTYLAKLSWCWQGALHMARRGPTEGIVRVGQGRDVQEVQINGLKALNRAIHGDIVAGEIQTPCCFPADTRRIPLLAARDQASMHHWHTALARRSRHPHADLS